MRRTIVIEKIIVYFVLTFFGVFFLFPVLHTVLISLKYPADAFSLPPKWIFIPTLKYHFHIWFKEPFLKYLMNTLIIAGSTVAISVPIASLAGYGFTRHKITPKFTFAILFGLLAVRMFPRMLLVIPYFLIARTLHLHDTLLIMILIMVAFNQPFSIWLMRGFCLSIPRELNEAAIVDGCSHLGAFFRVIVPALAPGIASTAIFSFLLAYNNYLFPFLLTGTNAKTLPVAIAEYGAEKIEYWSISAAGVTGVIIPIIVLMLFLQKYFVKGLTSGAIK